MLRIGYLAALSGLQVMLAWQLVPALALVLDRQLRLGSVADGWPAALQVLCAAAAAAGGALSLGFPSIALMRHAQRGPERFAGVPCWAVRATLAGAALLLLLGASMALDAWTGHRIDGGILASVAPLGPAGVAVMSSGALFGELLRRNRVARAADRSLPAEREAPRPHCGPAMASPRVRRAA